MKIEKYQQIINEEVAKLGYMVLADPKTWPKDREVLLTLIKEIDMANEVYNMENSGK